MKKLFLLAFAAFAFAACSSDDNDVPALKLATPAATYTIVSSESVKVTWKAVEHAVAYVYAVDGGAGVSTAATEVTIDPKGAASCVVTLRAVANDSSKYLDSDETKLTISDIRKTETVDFEAAKLGADGFIWGKPLATEQEEMNPYDPENPTMLSNLYYGSVYDEKLAQVYTRYSDFGHSGYDTWNGFVVSNHTDRETEGFMNDKSVYAESGADGSKQFATGYYSASTADGQGIPTVKFTSAVSVQSVAVANASYTYLYFKNDVTDPTKPDFKLIVTGYNGTTKTGEASTLLVSGKTVKAGWESLDLSKLGKVTSLDFALECTDVMAPLNFCIDNLAYVK